MSKIEELEQRLEVMEKVTKAYGIFKEEVEQLQKTLAELKESKKEGKWEPKDGEVYWYRDVDGDIYCDDWSNHIYDKNRCDNALIFPTKEECERYWHFMDTVKEKSYEFSKEEWEDVNIRKYYIFYSYNNTYFKVHSDLLCKELGKIYFRDEESAQYIIDNFKDELMEFWL